jgi:hypothetical protein
MSMKLRRLSVCLVALTAVAVGCGGSSRDDNAALTPTTGVGSTDPMNDMSGMDGMGGVADVAGSAATPDEDLGLTLVQTSAHYIVVLNIVGPELMYTPEEAAKRHPTEGEYMLVGGMAAIVASSRHFEAHIYSKVTGAADTASTPVITVTDLTDGTVVQPEPTLMQDVIIGPRDIHFGNNVVIRADHDFSVHLVIGTEEVTFHGRLL